MVRYLGPKEAHSLEGIYRECVIAGENLIKKPQNEENLNKKPFKGLEIKFVKFKALRRDH